MMLILLTILLLISNQSQADEIPKTIRKLVINQPTRAPAICPTGYIYNTNFNNAIKVIVIG